MEPNQNIAEVEKLSIELMKNLICNINNFMAVRSLSDVFLVFLLHCDAKTVNLLAINLSSDYYTPRKQFVNMPSDQLAELTIGGGTIIFCS